MTNLPGQVPPLSHIGSLHTLSYLLHVARLGRHIVRTEFERVTIRVRYAKGPTGTSGRVGAHLLDRDREEGIHRGLCHREQKEAGEIKPCMV